MRVQTNLSIITAALLSFYSNAFMIQTTLPCNTSPTSSTSLDASIDRREILRGIAGVAFGTVATAFDGKPASASYSAYTARENDWQQRQGNGGEKIFFLHP